MARKEQITALRRKWETGKGNRTAVSMEGKASAAYLAYLENFVADREVPLKVTTKPRYKQESLFGRNKFDSTIGSQEANG